MSETDFSKMEGHTPGPWFIEGITKRPSETIVWVSSGKTSAPMPVGSFYPILGDVMANSSLIAAAPAMKDEILRLRKELDYRQNIINELSEAVDMLGEAYDEERESYFDSFHNPNTGLIDNDDEREIVERMDGKLAKASAALKRARGEA